MSLFVYGRKRRTGHAPACATKMDKQETKCSRCTTTCCSIAFFLSDIANDGESVTLP